VSEIAATVALPNAVVAPARSIGQQASSLPKIRRIPPYVADRDEPPGL
jgi:hypothetical protein